MRIREVRLQSGISQKELATAIGVAPNTLSQYESGKRAPDFDTMGRISDYLHVSVDYLLGLGREKPIPEDEDGLNAEQSELVRLYEAAPPALRAAALAVLRSAEAQSKVQGEISEVE